MDIPDSFPSTPFDSLNLPEQFENTRFVQSQILKHVRDDGALSRDAITAILLGFFKLEGRIIVLEAAFEQLKTRLADSPNELAPLLLDSITPLINEQGNVIDDRLRSSFENQMDAVLEFGNTVLELKTRLERVEKILIREDGDE